MACSCCAGQALDVFGEKSGRRALRRYLRKGLEGKDARQMAAWATEAGLAGASVAEVGGGIGQIQAELVRRGADRGTVVEVVAGYERPARELADAVGIAERSSFLLADVVETPEALQPADVVVLRRVVCCSPAGPAVLAAAAGRTRRTLLASYPRDRVAVRAVVRLQNAGLALFRKRFRVFVHPPAVLRHAAEAQGFRLAEVARDAVWETARYEPAAS